MTYEQFPMGQEVKRTLCKFHQEGKCDKGTFIFFHFWAWHTNWKTSQGIRLDKLKFEYTIIIIIIPLFLNLSNS